VKTKYRCGLCDVGEHCYGCSNGAECECDCQYKCWACKDMIEDEANEVQDDEGHRYHDDCVPNF
jgi:hypothetical protein